MKTFFTTLSIGFLFSCIWILPQNAIAQTDSINKKQLKVEKCHHFENLFQLENYFLGGQPNLQAIEWLKQENVTTIINLRSNDENKEFTKTAFDEEQVAKNLALNYISIPMKGKEGFNPKTLKQFTEAINTENGKVLIHCKAGGRVTLVMMAYLIQTKGYSKEEAEAFGKQLTYFSPLEDLLGE
jgi:protein tyrosine phosphatase (PTP) superfamily phosphohydrolase (DUF442 family)